MISEFCTKKVLNIFCVGLTVSAKIAIQTVLSTCPSLWQSDHAPLKSDVWVKQCLTQISYLSSQSNVCNEISLFSGTCAWWWEVFRRSTARPSPQPCWVSSGMTLKLEKSFWTWCILNECSIWSQCLLRKLAKNLNEFLMDLQKWLHFNLGPSIDLRNVSDN